MVEATRVELLKGIPTPFPAVGNPCCVARAFVRKSFMAVCPFVFTPDFGRVFRSRGCGLRAAQAVLANAPIGR
jgi:hypothetical protein